MGGKYLRKKTDQQIRKERRTNWIIGSLSMILAGLLIWILLSRAIPLEPADTTPTVHYGSAYDQNQVNINLGYGLWITEVGAYTGAYVEDGSNDVVSGVMMIVVTNRGTQPVQYTQIEVPVGQKIAYFQLTTLPVGESVVLLEKERMRFPEGAIVTTAIAVDPVLFPEGLELYEKELQIQILDGLINVTNISGKDIDQEIIIYYKNSVDDLLYGGITYRCRITGGLLAGQTRQISASHARPNGSEVMLVTMGE